MQEIGSSHNYRIAIDVQKNRIYFWFIGDIMGASGTMNLLADTRKACDALISGFTGLGDFTETNLLGQPDTAQQVQTILMDSGLRKMASVWSRESFAKLIVDATAQKVAGGAYQQKRKVFHDRAEAEAWLDE
jgi:hypothetical protein